jgi:hypothetical protein
MKKVAMFVFNGEPMCFIHVLLNALDMKSKGYDVRIVMEGAATKLIPDLPKKENPLAGSYEKAKQQGLIHAVCKACSSKLGVLEAVKAEGLPLVDEMSGHPSMARYVNEGYEVLNF